MSETYSKPSHGWTCFHCGETFTTFGGARDHFGFDPSADPGCKIKLGSERGLLMVLRKSEKDAADAWSALHSESSDFAKAYHTAVDRHREQLTTAEEAGFERGVTQARSENYIAAYRAGQIAQAQEDARKASTIARDFGGCSCDACENSRATALDMERVFLANAERLRAEGNK